MVAAVDPHLVDSEEREVEAGANHAVGHSTEELSQKLNRGNEYYATRVTST